MSKDFYKVFNDGNIDHPEFIKLTNIYEGTQYYFKALKFKDDVRILLETPSPLDAKRFSLRDIIQMTFSDYYVEEDLTFESDVNSNYAEHFLTCMGSYVYVAFPPLDKSSWDRGNKEAAIEAIKQELVRRSISLKPNPKEEEESE